MPSIGQISGALTLDDLLTPQLGKAEKELSKFAKEVTGIDAPLSRLGAKLARYSDTGKSLIATLKEENKHLAGLKMSYQMGADAVSQYSVAIKVEEALTRANITANDLQGRTLANLVRQHEALRAAVEAERATAAKAAAEQAAAARQMEADIARANAAVVASLQAKRQQVELANEAHGALQREVQQLTGLNAAYSKGASAVAAYNMQQKIENELTRAGVALDSMQGQAMAKLIVEREALTRSIAKQASEEQAAILKAGQTGRTLFGTLAQLRIAWLGLTFVVGGAVGVLVQAQVQAERINNTLYAATGSTHAAGDALKFVRGEAERLGLNLQTSAQEFAKFAAATRGTVMEGGAAREVFSAVAEASAALGLSAEQSAGALNALQQMVSKGTVQAEELRGQFGERIPGAFNLAAKAMGVTTMELGDMLQKGQVLASDLLPKLAKELHNAYGEGAIRGAKSLNAELNRLSTTFFDLRVEAAKGAGLPALVKILNDLVKVIGGGLVHNLDLLMPILKGLLAMQIAKWAEAGATALLTFAANLKATGTAATGAAGPLGIILGLVMLIAQLPKTLSNRMQADIDAMVDSANATAAGIKIIRDIQRDIAEKGVAKINEDQANTIKGLIEGAKSEVANIEAQLAALKAEKPRMMGHGESEVMVGGPDPKKIAESSMALEMAKNKLGDYEKALSSATVETNKNAAATETDTAAWEKFLKEVQKVIDEADPAGKELRELQEKHALLKKAVDKGVISNEKYVDSLNALNEESMVTNRQWADARKEAERLTEAWADLRKELDPAGEKVRKYREDLAQLKELVDASVISQDQYNQKLTELEQSNADDVFEKHADAMRDLNKQLNDLMDDLQLEGDGLSDLLSIDRNSFASVEEYNEAVRELNIRLQYNAEIAKLAKDGRILTPAESQALFDEIARVSDLNKALDEQARLSSTTTEKWQAMADVFSSSNFGDKMFDGISAGIGQLISGFAKLKEAASKSAVDVASAWGAALQGVAGILDSLGVFQDSAGGFGGRGEGNYSQEGSAVGAIIGGIIGAYFGGPAGAQAGMAIGGAAGGMIGGFVKKGAEEALATIRIDMSGFDTQIRKAEGALGSAMTGLADSIGRTFEQIVGAIGGFATSLPNVDAKIRDGVISMTIGAVRKKFKEMDDAIAFAIKELLNQGTFTGIDDMIRVALKNSGASDMDALAADLDAVMEVLGFGLTDTGKSIQTFTRDLDVMRAQMERLLGGSEQLSRALSNITIEEANRWSALRDQITGHQKTNAELRAEKEREAVIFNAEKALRIADLKVRLQELQAQSQMVLSRAGIFNAELMIHKNFLEREAEYYQYRLRIEQEYANGMLNITQQIAAITELIGALSAIPDIKPGDIKIKGGKGKGKGISGPSPEQLIADAMNALGLESVALKTRLDDLGKALKFLQEKSAISAAQIAELGQMLYTDLLGQMAAVINDEETLRMLEEIRYDAQKANWLIEIERLKVLGAINEQQYQKLLGYLNALPADLPTDPGPSDAEQAADAIDALNLPLQKLKKDYADQSAAVANLTDQFQKGVVSADDYAAAIAELSDNSAISVMGMAVDILNTMGKSEEAAKLQYEIQKLQFKLKLIEFRMTIDHFLKIGAISEELFNQMALILDDAEKFKWPDFHFDPPSVEGGPGHTEDEEDPMENALLEAIDRLRSAFENYMDFLQELEAGPLSGATLRSQFESAQAEYMQVLAAAQGGDLDAIEQLPDIARTYLDLASQYLDPASGAYQQILAMVAAQVGDLAGEIEDILNAVPSQMQGTEIRLDTIIQIQRAWDRVWGTGFPGWDVIMGSGGGTGGGVIGRFGGSALLYGSDGISGVTNLAALQGATDEEGLRVCAPAVEAELASIKTVLINGFGRVAGATDEQTRAASMESFIPQVSSNSPRPVNPYGFKG